MKPASIISNRPLAFSILKLIFAIFFTLSTLLLAGCTTPGAETPVESDNEYVWPVPPAEAVLRFDRMFRAESSMARKLDWKEALLGKEADLYSSLKSPYGVHSDGKGRVYVADTKLPGLAVFDFNTRTFFLIGAEGSGRLIKIFGVAVDGNDRIYVTDSGAKTVRVFERDGTFVQNFNADDEFDRPIGIAIDPQRERVYVSDARKHHIVVFDYQGNQVKVLGEPGYAEAGKFSFPLHLAVDTKGMLYVVDSMNFRVQVVDPETESFRIVGEHGDGPGQFSRPRGVAVDSNGNIYVSDAAFNKVQMFNQNGELLLFFGTPDSRPGGFQLPAGLHVDANDQLFVADQINGRVQQFQYLGQPTITAETLDDPE